MLTITRVISHRGSGVKIGDDIRVKIYKHKGQKTIRMAVQAPPDVYVKRLEEDEIDEEIWKLKNPS